MTDQISSSTCFYHFNELIVPADTGDPWKDTAQKCLVGHIQGRGSIYELCFRTDWYGVWFGFQVDDYPLVVAHNGHCLQNMGLIGAAGANMAYYLPYFNGPDDLAVAMNDQVEFNKGVKIWMGNSHPEQDKKCFGLHVYVKGHDIEPGEGNLLDWTVVTDEPHPHTKLSSTKIKLEKHTD